MYGGNMSGRNMSRGKMSGSPVNRHFIVSPAASYFCRATPVIPRLHVSAALAVVRCPSVRQVSVRFLYCIETE